MVLVARINAEKNAVALCYALITAFDALLCSMIFASAKTSMPHIMALLLMIPGAQASPVVLIARDNHETDMASRHDNLDGHHGWPKVTIIVVVLLSVLVLALFGVLIWAIVSGKFSAKHLKTDPEAGHGQLRKSDQEAANGQRGIELKHMDSRKPKGSRRVREEEVDLTSLAGSSDDEDEDQKGQNARPSENTTAGMATTPYGRARANSFYGRARANALVDGIAPGERRVENNAPLVPAPLKPNSVHARARMFEQK
jgi:hypothetical protein